MVDWFAHDLLQELLNACAQESAPTQRLHDLLLAAEALVEAKAQTLDEAQERQIAQGLLSLYLEAQHQNRFADCEKIERAIQSWLLILAPTDNQSALLQTLCASLHDTCKVALQRSTLTLLVMIFESETYPQAVYETLIPTLLGLADLPALAHYLPVVYTGKVAYAVADLALVVLSLMGRHGPAGLLLETVRQHFAQEPEQLRLLARYSLESQILLTLTVVPESNQLYERYHLTLGRWFKLLERRERHPRRPLDADLAECLAIHQELLANVEEVRYPTALHLLDMLKASQAQPDQAWQEVWQAYLLQQLSTSNPYVYYQGTILLYESLFPETEKYHLKQIVDLISAAYTQNKEPYNHFAQRFLATLSVDWRDWRDWQNIFLTTSNAEQALQRFATADEAEVSDLCTILLGRLLQIQEAKESGQEIIEEVQCIVEAAKQVLAKTSAAQEELRETLLDILRFLPARSSEEITFVQELAKNASDQQTQQAVLRALRSARPHKDALPVLQAAASSPNKLIAEAAQQALEREKEREAQR